MTKATRSVIKLLARHSDWRAKEADEALQSEVYADAERWHWLLRLLLPALGLGFLASGILFFFAYNWDDIPKFGKLSLAGLAVAIPAILALVPRLSDQLRKYLVTTAAFLVGPFFGVFGQIYQTGANAYDLFFGWVIFIIVWVVAVDFAPLWLLFVALLNVTFSLYAEQVAADWTYGFTMMGMFGINAVATLGVLLKSRLDEENAYPSWLPKLFALAAVGFATVTCVYEILDGQFALTWLYYLLITLTAYGLLAVYAFVRRELYYFALLACSLIAIVTAFILMGDNNNGGAFFIATLWVMLTVAASSYGLNNLRKNWRYD